MPRAILADMGIGETLADARERAGLTVAEVSACTRIRQSLVSAIEQDNFGPCGGDFYARGHIRAIAAVVGADARPLISAYDAAHPAGGPAAGEDPPGPPPRRRKGLGLPWFLLLALVCP